MNSPAVSTLETSAPTLPRALPAWAYSHPEMTRLEYERILKPSWQIVCHINSIPDAGDFITLDIGGDSVVAVRNSQGQIQAFHNVCRHRGARILEGSRQLPGAITCPYHGWSYRLNGDLIGMPVRESFPGLDRSQHGLKPVRMAIAFGFVFVNLGGDPPPLESIWGSFLDDFTPHQFETMEPLGPLYIEHWDVDWKVAMDNYLESYHVPIGHPGLFRMFTPDYDDMACLPGVARGISWLRDRPSSRWSERMYQQLIGTGDGRLAAGASQALDLLQHAAEPGHGCVSRSDGLLSGAAARAGQVHHPGRLVCAAGRAARDAGRAVFVSADQPAGAARG